MAEGPDTSLAPIGSVHRTKVGREATEPMREDIRLLGTIRGDTVRDQNGEVVFDLVERARVESFRVRRSEIDRAELADMFDGIDIHLAIPVIRALTHFALLANVAEDIHRERRRAIHVAAGEPPRTAAWPPPTASSTRPISIRRPWPNADRCTGFAGDPAHPPKLVAGRSSTPSTASPS
jgi:phosphoenolpyruvate carboxylase